MLEHIEKKNAGILFQGEHEILMGLKKAILRGTKILTRYDREDIRSYLTGHGSSFEAFVEYGRRFSQELNEASPDHNEEVLGDNDNG